VGEAWHLPGARGTPRAGGPRPRHVDPETGDYPAGVSTAPEFRHSDLLPAGADDTPYRLLTTDGVYNC
jgi:hypothetical protein